MTYPLPNGAMIAPPADRSDNFSRVVAFVAVPSTVAAPRAVGLPPVRRTLAMTRGGGAQRSRRQVHRGVIRPLRRHWSRVIRHSVSFHPRADIHAAPGRVATASAPNHSARRATRAFASTVTP